VDLTSRPSDDELIALKERIKAAIAQGMDAGLHLLDAAKVAGVSQEMVLSNIGSDPDFQRWWMVSKERTRTCQDLLPQKLPADMIKKDALNSLVAAGLYEKLALIVALSDVDDPEARADIFKAAGIATKLMPQQSQQLQVKATMEEINAKQESEIVQEIQRADEELRALRLKEIEAEEANRGDGSIDSEG